MKVLFTCGGTAGHINPAIAVAREFQSHHPDCEVLFVGAENGMECRLVPKEGYQIETVASRPLRHSMSLKNIRYNVKTVANIPKTKKQAKAIIKKFQPDLVVGTGGYASYPVVQCAAKMGIATAIHESNAIPGVTTKMLAKVADIVMIGLDSARDQYPSNKKIIVTGTPVRPDFFQYTRKEAREKLGILDDRKLVLSYWGSLGAEFMNGLVVAMVMKEQTSGNAFRHIHGCGRNYEKMKDTFDKCRMELNAGAEILPYIYDMPLVMAAADLVVCRAGASTIAELSAIGKPAVLVPSPNVVNNHQEKNARLLEASQACVVLTEDELKNQGFDEKDLYDRVHELLENDEKLKELSTNISRIGTPNATQEIYKALHELVSY